MSLDIVLTEEEIERDRKKWQEAVDSLNRIYTSVKYELRRCEADNYWYITVVTDPSEVEILGEEISAEVRNEHGWVGVKFSDLQFKDPWFSWIKLPHSDFILDMVPYTTPSLDSYVGRFSYHPAEDELLLDRLASSHGNTISRFGHFEFNEYQRGIYARERNVILIRPYWNPKDEEGNFDPYGGFDSELNNLVTELTILMLHTNGLPKDVKIIKNVNNEIVKEYSFFV